MRKNKFLYSALAGLLLLATSCIYDDLPGSAAQEDDSGSKSQPGPGEAALSLSADVTVQGGVAGFVQENTDAAFTRAGSAAGTAIQSTQFDVGEQFYAYFPNGVRISTSDGTSVLFTATSTSTPSTPSPLYFPAGVTSVPIHAYYPSSVHEDASSFSVQQTQTSDANYKASDLMYATCNATRTAGAAQGSGSLTFSHKMVKIIVSAGIGSGVTTITDIRIVGGHRTVALSGMPALTLGTASDALSTSSYITMYTGGDTGSASCAALIVPETSFTGEFLQVVTNMGTATYSLSGKDLEGGKAYTFNITVSAAEIGITTTINGWDVQESVNLNNNGLETLS